MHKLDIFTDLRRAARRQLRLDAADLVVANLLREKETWVVVEAPARGSGDGIPFADRFCFIDGFAMTCGVVVPVTDGTRSGVSRCTLIKRNRARVRIDRTRPIRRTAARIVPACG